MARRFSSVSDQINFGSDASIDQLTKFTWFFWFKTNHTLNNSFPTIVTKIEKFLTFRFPNSNVDEISFQVNGFSGKKNFYATTGDSLLTNTWMFVGVTYDQSLSSNKGKIYLGTTYADFAENAISTTETAGSVKSDSSSDLIVQDDPDATMDIAVFGVASEVMTLEQLRQCMIGKYVPSAQVKIYAPLPGNSSPEADLSGNSNNGTVTGTTKADHAPVGFYSPMQRFHRIVVSAGGAIQVLKQTILKHNTIEAINKPTILKQNLRTAISKSTILKQNISAAIQKTVIIKQNLKNAIQKTVIIKQNLKNAIQKLVIIKQNILAATTSFLLLEDGVSFLLLEDGSSKLILESSPNIIQVLKQIILKHNIIASINKSTILKQNLKNATQKIVILKQNLKSAITKLIIIKQSILPTLAHPFEVVSNPDGWEDTTFGNGNGDLVDELNTNDDDASAIKSPTNSSGTSTVIFKVQPMVDPLSSSGHKLRIRSRAHSSIIGMQIFLKQGGTTIIDIVDIVVIDYLTSEVTLSGAQADSITDYSDLTLELNANYFASDALIVSFIEFEVPPTQLMARIIQIIKHNIIFPTTKSTIIKQNIRLSVLKNTILKQNIISSILKSVIIKQNVIQAILKSVIIKQNILNIFAILKQVIIKQNIIAPTNKNTIIKQNLKINVQKSTILKQNILIATQKLIIIKQNLKSAILKSVIIKQNVIQSILKNTILKQNILGSIVKVLKSVILKQNIIAPTNKLTIIKQNIQAAITKSTTIKQNILTAILKNTILKHQLITAILKNTILKHQIISTVLKSTIIKHNIDLVLSNTRKIIGSLKSNNSIKKGLKSFLDMKKGLKS